MSHKHVADLLDAYALGALEPDEVDAVERHLEGCASCRALAAQARSVGNLLLSAVPQVAPPPSLRARVLARIAQERDASAAHDVNGTAPPASAPEPQQGRSLGKMLRALFGGEPPREDEHAAAVLRALLAEPDTLIWSVGGTDAAPGASARLIGSPTRRDAVLVTNGLHAPAAGQAYQVWFLSGGQPVPNALFTVDRAGQAASVLRAGAPLQRYDTVAVTPEPAGGSPAPTGPIVLAGSLA